MSASCRPPLDDPRLDFVEDARRFARENRGRLAFRFLRAFTRCDDAGLEALLAKLYCETLPEFIGKPETLAHSLLKALLHPFFYLLRKRWLWRPEPPVLYDMEVSQESYFEHYAARVFAALPHPKRVTPATRPLALPEASSTEPLTESITPSSLLGLFLSPLMLPSLLLLSRRTRRNFLAPFRRALSLYAVNEGHFRRYPCRHFLTFDDVLNHPCRYFAFKQNCPGRLCAVQNGIRNYQPIHAFGMVDDYFSSGRFLLRLAPELGLHAPRIHPVGCLNIDRWRPLYLELLRGPREPLFDVLFLDQGFWPFNGLDRRSGKDGAEALLRNLNELKRRHPRLRVAIQLRGYEGAPEHERFVKETHARLLTEPIEVLDNAGKGESYRSVFRSRLMITYCSTLGYEAFFFGENKKGLFVNYAGNPYAYCCEDPRFQLYDEKADYAVFEEKVLGLLALDLPGPPPIALEQQGEFDGRVQERIAAVLTGKDFLP